MKASTQEWYPLSADERQQLVADGLFVFDTNALLTMYRLSVADRQLVVDLMESVKDRLWIPYTVAEEFQRNRLKRYYEQLAAYDDLQGLIEKLRNQLVVSATSHPVLTQEDIKSEVNDRLNSLSKYLKEQQELRHPGDLADPKVADGVRDSLDTLFNGRVGARKEVSNARLVEGKRRFDLKIPPGYEDIKKPTPNRYGDYFLWSEALEFLTGRPAGVSPMLVVTEETKSDWWLKSPTGELIAPRPEMLREARDLGIFPVWFVSLRRFFEMVADHLGWEGVELGSFVPVEDPYSGEPAAGDGGAGIEEAPVDEGGPEASSTT